MATIETQKFVKTLVNGSIDTDAIKGTLSAYSRPAADAVEVESVVLVPAAEVTETAPVADAVDGVATAPTVATENEPAVTIVFRSTHSQTAYKTTVKESDPFTYFKRLDAEGNEIEGQNDTFGRRSTNRRRLVRANGRQFLVDDLSGYANAIAEAVGLF